MLGIEVKFWHEIGQQTVSDAGADVSRSSQAGMGDFTFMKSVIYRSLFCLKNIS
jgi:hypothetical protein